MSLDQAYRESLRLIRVGRGRTLFGACTGYFEQQPETARHFDDNCLGCLADLLRTPGPPVQALDVVGQYDAGHLQTGRQRYLERVALSV